MSAGAGTVILASNYGNNHIRLLSTAADSHFSHLKSNGGNPELIDVDDIPLNSFEYVYRPHISFASVPRKVDFRGRFDWGQKVRAVLSHDGTGDLIGKMYLMFTTPALRYTNDNGVTLPYDETQGGYTNSIGHAIIDKVEFEVDNQIVSTRYGIWMEIWRELTVPESKRAAFNDLIGKEETITDVLGNAQDEETYMVPLDFWFTHNYGVALPIISLTRCSVAVNIFLKPFSKMFVLKDSTSSEPDLLELREASLLVEYIYVDNAMRLDLAQKSQSYIVNDVQYNNGVDIHKDTRLVKVPLDFKNQVKAFYWAIQEKGAIQSNDHFNFSRRHQTGKFTLERNQNKLLKTAKIMINNEEVSPMLPEKYYRSLQSYERHTHGPFKDIYQYTFAFDPETLKQTGMIQMSAFDADKTRLECVITDPPKKETIDVGTGAITNTDTYNTVDLTIHVFALSINIFNVIDGKAGFEFEN